MKHGSRDLQLRKQGPVGHRAKLTQSLKIILCNGVYSIVAFRGTVLIDAYQSVLQPEKRWVLSFWPFWNQPYSFPSIHFVIALFPSLTLASLSGCHDSNANLTVLIQSSKIRWPLASEHNCPLLVSQTISMGIFRSDFTDLSSLICRGHRLFFVLRFEQLLRTLLNASPKSHHSNTVPKLDHWVDSDLCPGLSFDLILVFLCHLPDPKRGYYSILFLGHNLVPRLDDSSCWIKGGLSFSSLANIQHLHIRRVYSIFNWIKIFDLDKSTIASTIYCLSIIRFYDKDRE